VPRSGPMNVLICGDRNWTDRLAIRTWIAKLQDFGYDTVIEGGARGADSLAKEEAYAAGMNVREFSADWRRYGRAASPIRNAQMLTEGKPQLVVAFHKDLTNSRGTANMVKQAKEAGVSVIVVEN